jgi:hypothetical protein
VPLPPRTAPFWFAVQDFFNHLTHHRGPLTVLLEQFAADFGVTDALAGTSIQYLVRAGAAFLARCRSPVRCEATGRHTSQNPAGGTVGSWDRWFALWASTP